MVRPLPCRKRIFPEHCRGQAWPVDASFAAQPVAKLLSPCPQNEARYTLFTFNEPASLPPSLTFFLDDKFQSFFFLRIPRVACRVPRTRRSRRAHHQVPPALPPQAPTPPPPLRPLRRVPPRGEVTSFPSPTSRHCGSGWWWPKGGKRVWGQAA